MENSGSLGRRSTSREELAYRLDLLRAAVHQAARTLEDARTCVNGLLPEEEMEIDLDDLHEAERQMTYANTAISGFCVGITGLGN